MISTEQYDRYQTRWQNYQSACIARLASQCAKQKSVITHLREELKDRDRLIDVLCKAIRQRDEATKRNPL